MDIENGGEVDKSKELDVLNKGVASPRIRGTNASTVAVVGAAGAGAASGGGSSSGKSSFVRNAEKVVGQPADGLSKTDSRQKDDSNINSFTSGGGEKNASEKLVGRSMHSMHNIGEQGSGKKSVGSGKHILNNNNNNNNNNNQGIRKSGATSPGNGNGRLSLTRKGSAFLRSGSLVDGIGGLMSRSPKQGTDPGSNNISQICDTMLTITDASQGLSPQEMACLLNPYGTIRPESHDVEEQGNDQPYPYSTWTSPLIVNATLSPILRRFITQSVRQPETFP